MEASTPPHGPCLSLSPTRSTPVARGPNERRYTRYVTLHPIRRATPDPSRYTRYVAAHPLRRDTPDQKRCNAYGSGAPPPTTSQTADNSSPQTPTVHLGRCDTASTCSPGSEREALHPLRRATPVTSQCTRSEGVQCLRIGCTASRNKPNRGHFLPTHPSGSIRRSHTTSKYPPGSEREALHPLRRETPVTSQCTRSEEVQCLRIGYTAT